MVRSQSYQWYIEHNTPTSIPETQQAGRALRWLDQIAPTFPQERRTAYQRARRTQGEIARGRVRGTDIIMDVCGTGDNAFGHNRLRKVIQTVIVPMIEAGELRTEHVRQCMDLLRGCFAPEYRILERAFAAALHALAARAEDDHGWLHGSLVSCLDPSSV